MDSSPIICQYIDYSRDDTEFITYFEPEESFTSLLYSTFSSGDYGDGSDSSYSEYNPRSQARNEIGSPMEPQQIEKKLKDGRSYISKVDPLSPLDSPSPGSTQSTSNDEYSTDDSDWHYHLTVEERKSLHNLLMEASKVVAKANKRARRDLELYADSKLGKDVIDANKEYITKRIKEQYEGEHRLRNVFLIGIDDILA
ncbi:hypothetical protein BGX27_010398 [Mortierella sp. AM989]|nr:hypothetical protein BGX27_010398 [Mortierella sp. AM989]